MKKIIFLENMITRLKGKSIDLTLFNNLESILGDDKCNKILKQFEDNNSIFDNYEVIIIHESIYDESKRKDLFETLEMYCNTTNKTLVKFSGNNSQPTLVNNILTLSATKLYENIQVYLTEYEYNRANILMLAYGKQWSLNPLLNTLEKLNVFIENHIGIDPIDFDNFEDNYDFLELEDILDEKEYLKLFEEMGEYKDEISIEQVKTLITNLRQLIQSKANE